VNTLAGITLGAIIQSFAVIVVGTVIGFVYAPIIAAVGVACFPIILSAGYVRLLVVVPKDRANKAAHEESAHIACEAAGAIRTVASLTLEEECVRLYSDSLKAPLRRASITNLWSTGLYSFSQGLSFCVIGLVFWYGSRLVSTFVYNTKNFFVSLQTVTFAAIQAGK
jgi:ATP-binding cassette, subfamily B (MDR/TAP), member 1